MLPAQMQFNVPTISCAQLDQRPPASISDAKQQVVACEDGASKYLLDQAKVLGTDVVRRRRGARPDQRLGGQPGLHRRRPGQVDRADP